ncbi:hypothetical protein HYT92_01580 [Candidatus Pacearchaeota archaeon]|nr:hypothetical protein [Candidatus Pacearchaeota archaeon]
MATTELNEHTLPDSYIVYPNYLYVCDGKVVRSDIEGTVADLKRDLREHFKLEAKEICSCDATGRMKLK